MSVKVVECPVCEGNAPSCPACWGHNEVEVCGNCDAPKTRWIKTNMSHSYVDYEWTCSDCGKFVRESSH